MIAVVYVREGETVGFIDGKDGGSYRAPAPEDGCVVTVTERSVERTYYVPLSLITAAIDSRLGPSEHVNRPV